MDVEPRVVVLVLILILLTGGLKAEHIALMKIGGWGTAHTEVGDEPALG